MKMNIKRGIAYLLDLLIVGIINWFYIFSSHVFLIEKDMSKYYFMIICGFIVTIFAFIILPTKKNGKTIGKMIMKLKVVNKDKKPRTYWQNFGREFLLKYVGASVFVPMLIIYKIIDIIIHRKAGNEWPHDVLLKTEVIEEK